MFQIIEFIIKYVIKPKDWDSDGTKQACLTLVSTFHAFVAAMAASYTVLFMCDYPLAIFYSDGECLKTYRPFYTHCVLFSLAYFTYDLIYQIFVYK